MPARKARRFKRIELRTWAPPAHLLGQTIAIGASARISEDGWTPIGLYGLEADELAKGRIIGLVLLVNVRPATRADAEAAMLPGIESAIAMARAKGRTLLAWELAEPRPLDDDPRLACKGAVGRMTDVDLSFLPAGLFAGDKG